jgi:hypothetical protein
MDASMGFGMHMTLDALVRVGPWAALALVLATATARTIVLIWTIHKVPAEKLPVVIRALADFFAAHWLR